MWNLQIQGEDFAKIQAYAIECVEFTGRYNLSFPAGLARATQAGWLDPMIKGEDAPSIAETIARWEQSNHIASAGSYYVHRALVYYYFGEYAEAEAHLTEAEKYLAGLTDSVLKRQWHVFRILTTIKRHEQERHRSGAADLQEQIQLLIGKVEKWTALGPLLKPYLAFVYAERERAIGEFKTARSLYLDAIATANEHGYVCLEGHLNE